MLLIAAAIIPALFIMETGRKTRAKR
jgi:hypothetical protein